MRATKPSVMQETRNIWWKTLPQEKDHPCCCYTTINILLRKICLLHRFDDSHLHGDSTSYTITQHRSTKRLDSTDQFERLCSPQIYELPSAEIHHDQSILIQLCLDYPTTIGLIKCSFCQSFSIISPLF